MPFNIRLLKSIERRLNLIIDKCKCNQGSSGGSSLTQFTISSFTDFGCNAMEAPPLDQTIYHDGEGAFPVIGDTVYTDAAGTTPLVSPNSTSMYYLGDVNGGGFANAANWMLTDENGISVSYTCK